MSSQSKDRPSSKLARCWRGSCYGLGFAASAVFLIVMIWILWCYLGFTNLPTIAPQRRAIVDYGTTNSKSVEATQSTPPLPTFLQHNSTSQIYSSPVRSNSRGEAQLGLDRRKDYATVRPEDGLAKGDFNAREKFSSNSNTTQSRSAADIRNIEIKSTSTLSNIHQYKPRDLRDDDKRPPLIKDATESVTRRIILSSTTENKSSIDDGLSNEEKLTEEDRRVDTIDKNYENDRNKRPLDRDERTPLDRDERRPLDRDERRPLDRDERRPLDRDERRPLDRDDKRPLDRDDKRPLDRDDKRPLDRDDKRPLDRDDKRPLDRDETRPLDRDETRPLDRDERRPLDRDEARPLDRDETRPSKDDDRYYDKERPLPRSYPVEDSLNKRPSEEIFRRSPDSRALDREYSRERRPYDRDRDDYPRRRYDDGKRDYDRTEDDKDSRIRGSDSYETSKEGTRDSSIRDTDVRYRDDRYRSRSSDERYKDSDDRYRSRFDDEDRNPPRKGDDERDDRYRSSDGSYHRDDRYRDRPKDDRYRDDDRSRDFDKYKDRLPEGDEYRRRDDRYRSRDDAEELVRSEDIRPRQEERRYRDGVDDRNDKASHRDNIRSEAPRRSKDPIEYRSRDRARDQEDDYRVKESILPSRRDETSRTRARDDTRYDDSDRRRTRIRDERYDDDRYERDPLPRRHDDDDDRDDYKESRSSASKGEVPVRERPIYLVEDKILSKSLGGRSDDGALDRRSDLSSDDDYIKNRPRTDLKISDDEYRSSRRRSDDMDRSYRDDRYERRRDRLDYDDEFRDRSKGDYIRDRNRDRDNRRADDNDRNYPRRNDGYDGRYPSNKEVRPREDRTDDKIRDRKIEPSRTIADPRPLRSSMERTSAYQSEPKNYDDEYKRSPRRSEDDDYSRKASSYGRNEPRVYSSRGEDRADKRERRYDDTETPCIKKRNSFSDEPEGLSFRRIDDSDDCDSTSDDRHSTRAPSSTREYDGNRNSSSRPLTPKEIIDEAYRHEEVENQPREVIYPVYDPRVSNMTSEIIRPNERRGTIITARRRKRDFSRRK